MTGRDRLDALVVGGGRFGTALAAVLATLGRRVELAVRRAELALELNGLHQSPLYPGRQLPKRLHATVDLAGGVRRARLVLLAVPSTAFRQVARQVGDHLGGDQLLLHTTKCFEVETFKPPSLVLREETCALKIGVLAGPTLAAEVLAGHPAGALVASRFDELTRTVQQLFEGGPLRVYAGRDVVGAELAGAFRNVLALATGVSDGLGFGANTKALLVTRGLGEMARLGVAMGGEVLTFGGLAGVGDLLAATSSKASASHQVGYRLARGEPLEAVLGSNETVPEGVHMTRAVRRHALATGLDLPIVTALHALLFEKVPVAQALAELLATRVGAELAEPGR